MAEKVSQTLTENIYILMQKERFALLSTIDKDSGGPNVSAISWVYSPDIQRVFIAVDNRSRIVENIKNNNRATLSIFSAGSVYSISGSAAIASEKMEGVPLRLAKIELKVEEVRDIMFYGSRISQEPTYEKTYDADAAAKLDKQVMDALKA
ncbi:pyridoxamine 5'-phosphate oxidase family protein [Microaerobacter geothermalis]|uniref:pyridoxamine 5'-phosphate oxidase family protein n=1 Tax=Microaerobacter geothermalis TaxID=674972 RepID=UPI001F249651|nr:pyridoxamine 5'-phosphate oxidase family protein [Microaerobacter geothermalis]MCF6093554.1 pyridoxamine 5'-phosphate oxidase family protein [Microaerobacter geothermalis]